MYWKRGALRIERTHNVFSRYRFGACSCFFFHFPPAFPCSSLLTVSIIVYNAVHTKHAYWAQIRWLKVHGIVKTMWQIVRKRNTRRACSQTRVDSKRDTRATTEQGQNVHTAKENENQIKFDTYYGLSIIFGSYAMPYIWWMRALCVRAHACVCVCERWHRIFLGGWILKSILSTATYT